MALDLKFIPCRLSGGAIGGIVVCAVLSILLILLGAYVWHRRERNQGDPSAVVSSDRDTEISKTEHSFGTGPVIHHTPSLPALPPLRIPSPSDSAMVSVSPIESDSDVGESRMFTFSSEDSRTGFIPIDIELGSVPGPSKFVGRRLGEVKREHEPGVVRSLLHPPVMTFDGDPDGWRQVSQVPILRRTTPMLTDTSPIPNRV